MTMTMTAKERTLVSENTIFEQLEWRYATKGFDPERKISEKDWEVIRDAAILAPSSYGLQPYKMIVVTDPEMKARLKPACFNQPQIEGCSHLVIFAARKELDEAHIDAFLDHVAEKRNQTLESLEEFRGMLINLKDKLEQAGNALEWSQRQAYIALGFMLYTAALRGVDACPMEGFEPDKVDEILGLEGYRSTTLCALGYRSGEDWLEKLEKVRFPADELVERI